MLRNNIRICDQFFNYMLKEKYKVIKTMSNSTRTILANLSRIRNVDIERYFYQNFKNRFNEKKNKYFCTAGRFLLGASLFSFAEDRITDEEIQEHFQEFSGNEYKVSNNKQSKIVTEVSTKKIDNDFIENVFFHINYLTNTSSLPNDSLENIQLNNNDNKQSTVDSLNFIDSTWTQLIDSESVKLWRRPLTSNEKLYEYRLCGSFNDISAENFFFVQTDIEYRKSWDELVVDLRILETDEESKTEIIRWVTHYPYPMKDREYVFKRRSLRNDGQESAIIVSKAITSNSSTFENLHSNNVKVRDYKSLMYIQSHNTFKKRGMDYFLVYYDDPRTSFPNAAVSWMSTAGIPSFMDKVHKAALNLKEDQVPALEELTPGQDHSVQDESEASDLCSPKLPDESFYSYFTSALNSTYFSSPKCDYGVQHKSQ